MLVPTGASKGSLHSPGPGAPLTDRCPVTLGGWGHKRSHLPELCPSRHSKVQGTEARELAMKPASVQI